MKKENFHIHCSLALNMVELSDISAQIIENGFPKGWVGVKYGFLGIYNPVPQDNTPAAAPVLYDALQQAIRRSVLKVYVIRLPHMST